MARGSHAPMVPERVAARGNCRTARARGFTRQKAPERVEARGHHGRRVGAREARGSHAPEGSRARGSAWNTMGGAWERVKRVDHTRQKVPERVAARGSPWEARGSA
jgi:hypothetical protein